MLTAKPDTFGSTVPGADAIVELPFLEVVERLARAMSCSFGVCR